jgi:hypothetical protein
LRLLFVLSARRRRRAADGAHSGTAQRANPGIAAGDRRNPGPGAGADQSAGGGPGARITPAGGQSGDEDRGNDKLAQHDQTIPYKVETQKRAVPPGSLTA